MTNAVLKEATMLTSKLHTREFNAVMDGRKVSQVFLNTEVRVTCHLMFIEVLGPDAPAGTKPRRAIARATYSDVFRNAQTNLLFSSVSFKLIGEAEEWPGGMEDLKDLQQRRTTH